MDCLIISYSEVDQSRERTQFFNEDSRALDGWERFLHLNYIEYENDILLPNQLISLSKLKYENKLIRKLENGYFQEQDISLFYQMPVFG